MQTTRIISLVLALFLLGSLRVHAQYTQFSTNPVSLLFGVLKMEAEFPVGNHWAVEPEFSIMTKGQRYWTADYDSKGFRTGIVAKRYLDQEAPNLGWYGFAYVRHASINFSDYRQEGETPDQRDIDRIRTTIGFGAGQTFVGRDGFYYGWAFGIGRHLQNAKNYVNNVNGETISEPFDEEIMRFPLDVYGRISVGIRIFQPEGKNANDIYKDLEQARFEELREEMIQQMEKSNSTNQLNTRQLNELELRRLRHRIRNGNG